MNERPPLLRCAGLAKAYGPVSVLRDVSFALGAGQALGLVGENGAGKSTLLNLLVGNRRPDAGHMWLAGAPYEPRAPQDAARAGLALVHQELNLFGNLTVAENLFLTDFPRRGWGGWIDRAALGAQAAEHLRAVGLAVPPHTPVERLSPGERQLVEIAKAVGRRPRLLILDEPTSSLSAREGDQLFALLNRLRQQGTAILYVSHALGDVLRLCDEVLVLRDGEPVGGGRAAEFSRDRLVELMVGRPLRQLFPQRERRAATEPVLEVEHLSQPGVVRDISFRLHRGEVLGLFGLLGAGRSELARILFGLDPARTGCVRLAGESLDRASTRTRIQRGLAFVTEDRRQEGLCLDASIADNLLLVSLPRYAAGPFGAVSRTRAAAAVQALRSAVRLTASARDTQPVRTLSGGNQQKVVLGKWLLGRPRVLILDEPTRGIDVGAKFEIYQLIQQLAGDGAGLLLISSELEELTGLCDRILVLSHGEIRDELAADAFDRHRLLKSALRDDQTASPEAGAGPS